MKTPFRSNVFFAAMMIITTLAVTHVAMPKARAAAAPSEPFAALPALSADADQ